MNITSFFFFCTQIKNQDRTKKKKKNSKPYLTFHLSERPYVCAHLLLSLPSPVKVIYSLSINVISKIA